jgi:hypothetical protein
MINNINLTQIVSKNCGGYGAWIDNPLSSPAPGPQIWRGFQLGGGGRGRGGRGHRRKIRKSRTRMLHKSQKNKKHRQIKTRRH